MKILIPEKAAEIIKDGGVGAFPTETVYGLGAHLFNPAALDRIFTIKGRAAQQPLSLYIGDLGDLFKFVQELPREANRLIDLFWPGPLALVLPACPLIPPQAGARNGTVAFRFPEEQVTLHLLRLINAPLAGTSANKSGSLSPISPMDVAGELDDEIDFLVDGGKCRFQVESTVLDLTVKPFALLREGVISQEEIEEKAAIHCQPARVKVRNSHFVLLRGEKEAILSFLAKKSTQIEQGEAAFVGSRSFFKSVSIPRSHSYPDYAQERVIFRVLGEVQREGVPLIYLESIWPEDSRTYKRLMDRGEMLIL